MKAMVRYLALATALTSFGCVQAAPQEPTPVTPEPPRSAELGAVGASCSSPSDCASGICEGQGCGQGHGVCADSDRVCTMDLVAYCGCDGKTFNASSGCPKNRFQSRGECPGQEEPTSAARPAGSACDTGDECTSGVCEGQGCGAKQGVCAAEDRRCTRDRASYCGCDGTTFQASGSCPGKRYSKRGACEQASKGAAGASCNTGDDCQSGLCEGQGCSPNQGVCVSRRRICTRDLRAYCGCDGQTFRASGTCPGRRYAKRGSC